jgi:ketosteroid isomerase-like protein
MKKAIVLVPMLAAVLALAGWQKSTYAAEKGTDGAAASGGVEATILKLNEKIRAALLKGDAATIKDLYGEDYVSVSAIPGAPSTKADLIENLKSGKIKYDSIDVSDAKVHVYGPTMALVTTKAELKGKLGDQDISGSYRSSRLFVKRGGKWQAVFFQSTKVPTQMRTG